MKIHERHWGNEDDPDGRTVHASFDEKGDLVFTEIDYGPGARKFNGSDELESMLIVEAEHVDSFILEVCKAAFGQRRQMTLRRLERICINAGIEFRRLNSWD